MAVVCRFEMIEMICEVDKPQTVSSEMKTIAIFYRNNVPSHHR